MKTGPGAWAGCTVSVLLSLILSMGTLHAASNSLIIFGDSLCDVGNSYHAGNTTPVPPNYALGEYTDGPATTPSSTISGLWIEQLAGLAGLTKPTASSLGGFDYAFAGAVTGTTGTATPGLGDQVKAFLKSYPTPPSGSLYIIWGGNNDLLNVTTASALPAAETTAIANLKSEISQLAAAGAKNFLWVNLVQLGDTPKGAASGLSTQLNTTCTQFKTDWTTAISQLKTQYPTISVTGLDANSFTAGVISSPSTYGFTNVTVASQGLSVNPDKYVFWDALHPTTKFGQIMASFAYAKSGYFSQGVDTPTMPLWALVMLGLLLLAMVARSMSRAIEPR